MHELTVGIFSISELTPIILRIWVQSDLSKSLVVDDWVLVPRNRIITLTLLLSIHSRERYATFAITDVFPAPGSPHITTGDLKHSSQYFKWIYLFAITPQTLIRDLVNYLTVAQNGSRFNLTTIVRGTHCVQYRGYPAKRAWRVGPFWQDTLDIRHHVCIKISHKHYSDATWAS